MAKKQIGDALGEVTGIRVLPPDARGSWVEVSAHVTGHILDRAFEESITWRSTTRPDGTQYGEAETLMTVGGEVCTKVGYGIGVREGQGVTIWHGAEFQQTATGELKELLRSPVLFEGRVDEHSGKTETAYYAWE